MTETRLACVRGIKAVVLALLSVVFVRVAHAQPAFQYYSVVMLQTESVFNERLGNIDMLSAYLKQLVDAVNGAVKDLPKGDPARGFLVIGVRPGNRSRVWLDFKDPISDRVAKLLEQTASKIPPVSVKGGTLLFALKVGLWGGSPPTEMIPRPSAWRLEAEQAEGFIEYSDLVDRVWRE